MALLSDNAYNMYVFRRFINILLECDDNIDTLVRIRGPGNGRCYNRRLSVFGL